MANLNVLVVDDETAIRQVLASQIKKAGHQVSHVGDGNAALERLNSEQFDVCVCDIRLPDIDGIEVLRQARKSGIDTVFLMLTAFASVNTAITAMKLGAYDYLMKPMRNEDVIHRLVQIGDLLGLREENLRLKQMIKSQTPRGFVSRAPSMVQIERMIEKVARTSGTVLITGESGTGKTFIARRIHDMSGRAERSFVSVNCGAIPDNLMESEFFGHAKGAFTGAERAKKGLFLEADGGTLFLDEISELPLGLQVKLLHALDEKEIRAVGTEVSRKVDVRILAATNRNIESMVAGGTFREDLYYRLNVLNLILPPLRKRQEDLPDLIRYFLTREAERLELEPEFTLSAEAERILVHHDWLGNLRELQNTIARTLILAEDTEIQVNDLPPKTLHQAAADERLGITISSTDGPLKERVRQFEADVIQQVIDEVSGDRQEAAKKLGIGLSTLYRKLEEDEQG
ncbi:sigma-54-dependent transcriptional regulator [Sedimenticola hydrogenitrophicus]|uniref:sigma-54-dependent transcriptional regulator n=1 Tax=Sedimenticola hydrogenitrophicus TaxID=2967975 RepID=UPI0023B08232|nr:sigma-54 dependent transcriptional regulator [Sedimenticola hydrogenitrophicus]